MFKTLKNEEGVVFVTVLTIIIVMMVIAINIISINISQVKLTEGEVKRVQSELLAKGALFYFLANQQTDSAADLVTLPTETLDNVTFTIIANKDLAGTGVQQTSDLTIDVTY